MRTLAALCLSVWSCSFLSCVGAGPRPDPSASSVAAATSGKQEGLGAAAALVSGKPESFTAACKEAIAQARAGIEQLKAMPAPRDTTASITVYDRATAALNDLDAQADVARNASPDPKLREAAEACDQEIQKLNTELSLDRGLYDALSALDLAAQEPATRYWMGRELREFRRAGVDRDEPTRAKVKALNEELVKIGQEFSRNIRDDVRKVQLEPAELDGLPADYIKGHAPGPDGKVTLTTDYPDVFPFLSYAKNAGAREKLWRVFNNRAAPQNLAVLSRMLEKRYQLANLLGYPNWAAYTTENKMIGTAQAASEFIDKIAAAAEKRSKAELAVLLARKQKDLPGADKVDPWDSSYYSDRVKAEQYHFDAQAARPYFEFSHMQKGVLEVASRLFGVSFRPVSGATVWHPDVEAFDVLEGSGGAVLGRIYLDLHPRDGKFKHAAQYTLVSGQESVRLPEGVLLCNFPKPGAVPALMEHGEVGTMFHEFGHLLHHVLGGHTRWASLSGVRTEWDFVEAPSQMLEEWTRDPETLQTFAKDYRDEKPIPTELVQQLRAADEYGKGMSVRRQMFLAATSLHLHDRDPKGLDTTEEMARLQSRYSPFPYVPGTAFQAAFGHLEGYSAAYYTYMWSLVIAKDLFTVFEQHGLFDPESAKRYRRAVLEPGGGKPAAELVRDFLGRPYDFRAYEAWLDRG